MTHASILRSVTAASLLGATVLAFVACGSDAETRSFDDPDSGLQSGDGGPASGSFAVEGTVTGLHGTGLTLKNNGGDAITVAPTGGGPASFAFSTKVASGKPYSVTIETQPTVPTQVCGIMNGSGTIAGADVENVTVDCETSSFTVGVDVSGLVGTGLVLQNNGGGDLPITANGGATFATPLLSGATYDVTVLTQPSTPPQTCVGGKGVVAAANVVVPVTCTTDKYTVGGKVIGLAQGESVVLQNNGGGNLTVGANGTFTFAAPVESGKTYAVTVLTNPASTTCTVTKADGTMGVAKVEDVLVSCCAAGMIVANDKCQATYHITQTGQFYGSTATATCGTTSLYHHNHGAAGSYFGIKWTDTAPLGYVASAVTADLFLGINSTPAPTTPALTLNTVAAGTYNAAVTTDTCDATAGNASVNLSAGAVAAYLRGAENDLRSSTNGTPEHEGLNRTAAENDSYAKITVTY